MQKRLHNEHIKLVCKSLATYQRFEMDNILDWKIKNSTGFQKQENERKLAIQNFEKGLLDELKLVLDQSILTSKETEKNLVDGIDDVLANEFSEQLTGKTTQQQIRELKDELDYTEEQVEELEEQVERQNRIIEKLIAEKNKPWRKR